MASANCHIWRTQISYLAEVHVKEKVLENMIHPKLIFVSLFLKYTPHPPAPFLGRGDHSENEVQVALSAT